MSVDVHPFPRDGTPIGLLAAANLLPPLAALGDLQVAYMLVAPSCEAGTNLPLHLVHAVMLALALGGGLCGWVAWRRVGIDRPHSDAGRASRSRFFALVGMLSTLLFVLVIVAQWLADFALSPCQ